MKYMKKTYGFTTEFPNQLNKLYNEAKDYVFNKFRVSKDQHRRGFGFGYGTRNPNRTIVEHIVNVWEPPIHGYEIQDYYDFVDYIYEYTAHLNQRDSLDDIAEAYYRMFRYDYGTTSWRYVLYSFTPQSDFSFLQPKTFVGSLTFPKQVNSLNALRNNMKLKEKELQKRINSGTDFRHGYLAKRSLLPSSSLSSWDMNKSSKKNLELGYIRAIELNEFLEYGKDDQTLQNFIEKNTEYKQHVLNYNLRNLTYRQLIIDSMSEKRMPKFLSLPEFHNNGVTVHKKLLEITKRQYLELYQNTDKNPNILRIDNQSQTLRYATDFLEKFFSEDEAEEALEFRVLSLPEVQQKLFKLFFESDTDIFIRESTSGKSYNALHETYSGVYGLTQLFLHESSMHFDEKSCALFSAMIGNDGKGLNGSKTLEIMYLTYALGDTRHFAHKNTGLQTAADLLTEAIVEGRLSAPVVLRFIVEAMKDEKHVPLIDEKTDSIGLLDDDTPIEWVMSMFTTRKRVIKQPRLVDQTKQVA